VEHLRVQRPRLQPFAFVATTGSAGTLGAGDHLKQRYGTRIVAAEPLECATMLRNGFGDHNIQGIGDKHIPPHPQRHEHRRGGGGLGPQHGPAGWGLAHRGRAAGPAGVPGAGAVVAGGDGPRRSGRGWPMWWPRWRWPA
ncbi:hypothetical protein B1B_00165, partial [mine drainage metagenome]